MGSCETLVERRDIQRKSINVQTGYSYFWRQISKREVSPSRLKSSGFVPTLQTQIFSNLVVFFSNQRNSILYVVLRD